MNNNIQNRLAIRSAMFKEGWRRMARNKPENGQEILLGKEWIDRKYGVTDQFITSLGEYNSSEDAIYICADGLIVGNKPPNYFHWWKPIFRPDKINILLLRLSNRLKAGPRMYFDLQEESGAGHERQNSDHPAR